MLAGTGNHSSDKDARSGEVARLPCTVGASGLATAGVAALATAGVVTLTMARVTALATARVTGLLGHAEADFDESL